MKEIGEETFKSKKIRSAYKNQSGKMGKEMQIIVLLIVFLVIFPFDCKSIHKRQPKMNFAVEEEASEEVAVTGSAGEDSPGIIPGEVSNSTIVEIDENATDVELSYQSNESQRVKRSQPSASRRPQNNVCKKRKSRETRSRRHQPQVREMQKYLNEIVQ